MTRDPDDHFKSQTPDNHVKYVRDKHGVCKGEPHTTFKGFFYHLANHALSTGVFLFFIRTLLFLVPTSRSIQVKSLISLGVGWTFYHGCLKARKVWAYIELSHRSMLEEKNEIEKNFDQERIELRVLFENQGFKDPLLQEMVEYVCSDSTLLLDTMIREELSIRKEDLPHPLIQGGSRILGGLCGLVIFLPLVLCISYTLAGIFSALMVLILSFLKAKILENDKISEMIWVLGIFITSVSIISSLMKLL
ncbi:VIT1/CCC1 transporter family protein [Candidatus Chlamydia corallus]|uniref:VIT1/CCC1 transporter family protein n=1 Tax=Candidatus Chlamydia corallus TaxID=2038470 RepID=UPI000C2FD039|nr:VIT1/CCC1 transporter family protein [Candidatus Chlamydia corallus]